MINKICILILISFFISCSNKNLTKIELDLNIQEPFFEFQNEHCIIKFSQSDMLSTLYEMSDNVNDKMYLNFFYERKDSVYHYDKIDLSGSGIHMFDYITLKIMKTLLFKGKVSILNKNSNLYEKYIFHEIVDDGYLVSDCFYFGDKDFFFKSGRTIR